MAVRPTMAPLITLTRLMIADPAGMNQQFQDQDVQDRLDANRDDIRYESLKMAPSIVNINNTAQSAQTIFADYYSDYQWWETDIVLQGQGPTGLPWIVLSPVASDYIVGKWQFELTPFVNGMVPGQVPPVFATGKIYDVNASAADLLEFWSSALTSQFDFTSDGQSFRVSQIMAMKLQMASRYRSLAKPRLAKMHRTDVSPLTRSRDLRLLDSDNLIKGGR